MGEQLRTQHRLEVPIDIPSNVAELKLHAALESVDGIKLVTLTQGDDNLATITLVLRDHLFDMPPISNPSNAQFGTNIRLLGYDFDTQDEQIDLTLYWQAINTPASNYTVFTHLVNENGEIVAQVDSPPVGEAWLTSAWLPNEIIVDKRQIPLPDGLENGRYHFALGLYDNNGRLSVIQDDHLESDDKFILSPINLE